MSSNVRDWNGVTHERVSRLNAVLRSYGHGYGYGFDVEVTCGRVYNSRAVDFEAHGEIDCMACVAARAA